MDVNLYKIAVLYGFEKNAFGVTVARLSWRQKVWVRIPVVFKVMVVDSHLNVCKTSVRIRTGPPIKIKNLGLTWF